MTGQTKRRAFDECNQLASRFIGVIDLKDGAAVHAVGGRRDEYAPLHSFHIDNQVDIRIDGDSGRLIDSYQLAGIRSFYVADLDGIRFGRWQRVKIESLADTCREQERLYLDLGVRGALTPGDLKWIRDLASEYRNTVFIVATECAGNVTRLDELSSCVPQDRIAVSFDYKDSAWLSQQTSEQDWFRACLESNVTTVIGLDLAAVGGSSVERTIRLCQHIRGQLPDVRYLTGGGVRSDRDAQRLLEVGADALLVASRFVD